MSAFELQKAVYARLSTGTRAVYDDVKPKSAYPYVVVGDDTLVENGTDSFNGFIATVTIHTWSDKKGRSEIKTMQDEIYGLLNRFKLSILGYNTQDCYQEFSESFLDPDGITRHGIQRYRVIFDKS